MADTDFTGAQDFASESRKYGVFRWGLLFSAVLLLLVVAITVVLIFTVYSTTVIFAVLVICLIVAGALVCFFLEWLRRRALRRRDEGASAWIRHTLSDIQLAVEREPPPLPEPSTSSLTPRSSWIHWAPWKSSRSNGPPSSRSTEPPSTRSTDSPSNTILARS
jgi:amino acid transporter